MKKTALLLSALLLPHFTASAVTISIDAEVLKDQFGNPMAQTGVVVLVAGTDGTVSGPFGTSFTSGADLFLASWDLSAWATDGVFSGITADLPFSGNWGTGDPLQMYWYPSLTLADAGPTAGIPYGTFTDPTGIDLSAPWITPNESDTVALSFYTTDASFLGTGTNDPNAALAANFVPPVPGAVPDTGGTLMLLSAGLAGMTVLRRKLRSKQTK